jgi:hypothetical protein
MATLGVDVVSVPVGVVIPATQLLYCCIVTVMVTVSPACMYPSPLVHPDSVKDTAEKRTGASGGVASCPSTYVSGA